MDKPDCFALMLEDESQAECTFSAIKLEEVVIVPSRWRQKAMVSGDASRWRNSPKSSCVPMHWHTEPRSKRQTCIDEVDFDTDVQPGGDPQNGQ